MSPACQLASGLTDLPNAMRRLRRDRRAKVAMYEDRGTTEVGTKRHLAHRYAGRTETNEKARYYRPTPSRPLHNSVMKREELTKSRTDPFRPVYDPFTFTHQYYFRATLGDHKWVHSDYWIDDASVSHLRKDLK